MDMVQRSFSAIANIQPLKFYLASDGPRKDVYGECDLVKSIREFMLDSVTWECDLKTLFRDKNLGCKKAVSSAIDWFFKHEYEGIIIEDDCLPDPTFFHFCSELLKSHKDDPQVGMITGTSYLFNEAISSDDYFFSKYHAVWGWATWRDRWNLYDMNARQWPRAEVSEAIREFIDWDVYIANFYIRAYEKVINGQLDTWDYQWVFACMYNQLYCLTPYRNLVKNIGFEGTRSDDKSPFLNMRTCSITDLSSLTLTSLQNSSSVDNKLFFNVFYRFSKRRVLKSLARLGLSVRKRILNWQ
jgi:hypothetical protein